MQSEGSLYTWLRQEWKVIILWAALLDSFAPIILYYVWLNSAINSKVLWFSHFTDTLPAHYTGQFWGDPSTPTATVNQTAPRMNHPIKTEKLKSNNSQFQRDFSKSPKRTPHTSTSFFLTATLNIPIYHGCLSINKDLLLHGIKTTTHKCTQHSHCTAVLSFVTQRKRCLTKAIESDYHFTVTQQRQEFIVKDSRVTAETWCITKSVRKYWQG